MRKITKSTHRLNRAVGPLSKPIRRVFHSPSERAEFLQELKAVASILLTKTELEVVSRTSMVKPGPNLVAATAVALSLTIARVIEIRDEALRKLRNFVLANYPSVARYWAGQGDMVPVVG